LRSFIDYENMAMLELPESERASLNERFDVLVDGFSALDKYDTSGVLPLVTVLDLHNVLREDVPEKFMPREDLLKNAPEHHDGYFQVPATIE
jgi:aspartyl-tRNA(Asn)/glutamyl-tRNA(Gln) amidotransferase subunit C